MARSKSLITSKTHGKIGDVIIRNTRYGTVVTKLHAKRTTPLSDAQAGTCANFKEAIVYAQGIIADPEKKKQYSTKWLLKRYKTAFHAAVADFLKKKKKG